MVIKFLKTLLKFYALFMLLVLIFFSALHIQGRIKLGHWPDERETKCIGRRVIEGAAGPQNWTDDLGCGK
jgi:hypothetical protein